jgi:hypothetical protein
MGRRALAALVVCVAAVVPYLSTLDDYFVQDDFGVVSLLSQKPASAFPGWFVSTWMDDIWGYTPDEIRPFPAVTYQIAAWGGAGSPVLNHALNIALHAANALLVLAIGLIAGRLGLLAATSAAVVFAVLPIHPETVAWVTGRVDSMPAFFYLAAFLAYASWRQSGIARRYLWSIGLFFVALFSKQNTITLPAALLLYDLVVDARPVRASWAWVRPYLPFAVMTVGYLALRYALFGQVAREDQLSATGFGAFAQLASRHLGRIVSGDVVPPGQLAVLLAFVLAVIFAASRLNDGVRRARTAFYVLVVWIGLGIAPTLVAGYESPRHIYLAAVGWAIGVGLATQVLWGARPRPLMRTLALVSVTTLVAYYGLLLRDVIGRWHVRAAVSSLAAEDLRREARAAPGGSLIVAGAPVASWEWSLPFVVKPPYTDSDLTERVHIVSPMALYCCRTQWNDDMRRALESWSRNPEAPPVIAFFWDDRTGAASRVTDRDDPFLRTLMQALVETSGAQALDGGLTGAIDLAKRARVTIPRAPDTHRTP